MSQLSPRPPGDQTAMRHAGRRQQVSVPASLADDHLSNEAIGLFVRFAILDQRGEECDLRRLAAATACSEETVGELVSTLCAAGYLTTDAPEPTALDRVPAPTAAPGPLSYTKRWLCARSAMDPTRCPPDRVPVVYFLHDLADTVAYIGSTDLFWRRIRGHRDKPWIRYSARGCETRADAYLLEAVEIDRLRPYLNGPDIAQATRLAAALARGVAA